MRFSKNLLWSLIVVIGLFTGTVLFLVNGDSPESVRIESSGENKPDG